jgi:hypothetical protein
MTVDDPPAGNLCGDPLLVTTLPFTWSGADLAVDYTDDVRFTGTSCTLADGPELIFRLDAFAGEQIVLSESGTLDAVLRVLEDCTPTAPCLYSQDAPENPAFTFVAPHDGSYFFVVESLNAYPATRGYSVRLSHP